MARLPWRDTPAAYGLVTRCLHWSMAALFAWQWLSMACRLIFGRTPVTAVMVGSHAAVGTVLLILVLVRIGWFLANRQHRPSHQGDRLAGLARAGHALLYALMLVIPAIALLRHYGAGRPLSILGVPVLQARPEKIEWMIAPANAVHGWLGWLLLAVVVGHVGAVLLHRFVWRDGVTARMLGRPRV